MIIAADSTVMTVTPAAVLEAVGQQVHRWQIPPPRASGREALIDFSGVSSTSRRQLSGLGRRDHTTASLGMWGIKPLRHRVGVNQGRAEVAETPGSMGGRRGPPGIVNDPKGWLGTSRPDMPSPPGRGF